jgi:hypothetical protein
MRFRHRQAIPAIGGQDDGMTLFFQALPKQLGHATLIFDY